MEYNYNRQYELILGRPTLNKTVYIGEDEAPEEFRFYEHYTQEVEGAAIKITDLHFTAKIQRATKGSGSSSDQTSFEIYNLSSFSRAYAELEGAVIILKAGYANSKKLPLVYAGQIKKVYTTTDGADSVTHIVAGDAYSPRKNSRISKYYPPFFSKTDIIRDVALSLPGIAESVIATPKLDSQFYNSGYSATGKTIEVLEKLCQSEGYEVIIENNRVTVRPEFFSADSIEFNRLRAIGFQLSPTQIKRSSGKMNNNVQDLSNQKTTKAGYEFHLFLEGRIHNGSFVEVQEGPLEGVYKVIGLTHKLSYRGQDWDTVVDTEAI